MLFFCSFIIYSGVLFFLATVHLKIENICNYIRLFRLVLFARHFDHVKMEFYAEINVLRLILNAFIVMINTQDFIVTSKKVNLLLQSFIISYMSIQKIVIQFRPRFLYSSRHFGLSNIFFCEYE